MEEDSTNLRKELLCNSKRILLKVGTRLLTDASQIPLLMEQIAKIRAKGYEVILVSSGAVGIGLQTLKQTKRPQQLSRTQAYASIGQGKLMSLYENAAKEYDFHVGQLLLTMDNLRSRQQHLNMLNCINTLLSMNILPIVNENDSVAVEELTFGDNDILASLLATMSRCEITVLLSTVDGFQNTENPESPERISVIKSITPKIKNLAFDTDDSNHSIGGMKSKLKAAEIAMSSGSHLWIADGRKFSDIETIFRGEDIGTLFTPTTSKQMRSRKRWLSFFSKSQGNLYIDEGAETAITHYGKSLLPSGVISVTGEFKKGSTVDIINKNNKVIGRGLVNYNDREIKKILGNKSSLIKQILGYNGDDELIHRDNLVINHNSK